MATGEGNISVYILIYPQSRHPADNLDRILWSTITFPE